MSADMQANITAALRELRDAEESLSDALQTAAIVASASAAPDPVDAETVVRLIASIHGATVALQGGIDRLDSDPVEVAP